MSHSIADRGQKNVGVGVPAGVHGFSGFGFARSHPKPPVRALIDDAWISLSELGLADGASLNRFSCTTDLDAAVQNAQFVQESVPESLPLKQAVYEQLGELVAKDVVICSSTSGLRMTDIQAKCASAERTVVGHPFNPPYLLPLVEVVGGEKTSPDAVQWAADFYRAAGKAPLVLKREIPGFVATRLQEAIWREALHMIANDEASVEDIDFAVPGPVCVIISFWATASIGSPLRL